MKKRIKGTKEREQNEKLFENVASAFEFEMLQGCFDRLRFEVIDVNINENGDYCGLVLCLGFPFYFEAHVENGHTEIEKIESIELPFDDSFDLEEAEREFANLSLFSF